MRTQRVASSSGYVDGKFDRCWDGFNYRMTEEPGWSACDCMKNNSWKDRRLHCAVRPSLEEKVQVADLRPGADDCHAPERNVRNDEMSNWMWIDVGLVIIGDVGWPTASLVTDRRRRRKEPEEDEKCVCEVRATSTRSSG